MRTILTVLAMFICLGVATNVLANRGREEIRFFSQTGTVTFKHVEHTKRGSKCTTCHHEGVLSGTCRKCHNGETAPPFEKVAHKICKDCHKQGSGPTKCEGCHVK